MEIYKLEVIDFSVPISPDLFRICYSERELSSSQLIANGIDLLFKFHNNSSGIKKAKVGIASEKTLIECDAEIRKLLDISQIVKEYPNQELRLGNNPIPDIIGDSYIRDKEFCYILDVYTGIKIWYNIKFYIFEQQKIKLSHSLGQIENLLTHESSIIRDAVKEFLNETG